MLADKQTNFENHHNQTFLPRKQFKSYVCSFTVLSCSTFNMAFVANIASYMFNSEFFTRLEISDLLTNSFCFIFTSSVSFVYLL